MQPSSTSSPGRPHTATAAVSGGALETRSINNCQEKFRQPSTRCQALLPNPFSGKYSLGPISEILLFKCLDEVSDVHGHLLDLSAVELLNLAHHSDVLGGDEVDGNTLSAETTTTTDSVNVVLSVGGEIVVDDQGNLLDIDTTGQEIGGDQDTRRAGSELLHDQITLSLVHVTVHGGDSEITGSELVGEPVDLSAGVAEDDGLGDGDGLVQVGEGVELPLLLLNGNVELLDTLQGKLVLLDQDTDGVTHELGGDLKDVLGHGGGQEDNLGGLGEELEDVVNLLSETTLERKC